MIRKTVLCFAAAASMAASAQAADPFSGAGYKDEPAVPVSTWTGFYAGLNGGYGWSGTSSTLYAESLNKIVQESATSPLESFDKTGGFGGGQIGYNQQLGAFVLGGETDIQGADITGHAAAAAAFDSPRLYLPVITGSPRSGFHFRNVFLGCVGPCTISAQSNKESSLDYFGTARGRIGYTFGPALFYATGGFAYGGVSGASSITLQNIYPNRAYTYQYNASSSATRTGYTVGGGLEYAFTPLWSLKGEYDYLDFGSGGDGFIGYHTPLARARGYYHGEQNYNTVRLGLNFKIADLAAPLK